MTQQSLFHNSIALPANKFVTIRNSDICERKHNNNSESVAANSRANPNKQNHREIILKMLAVRPMTSKEIAVKLHKTINCVSGRVTELLKLGLIERTEEVREGAREVRLIQK